MPICEPGLDEILVRKVEAGRLSVIEILRDADLVVILTKWNEVQAFDLKRIASVLHGPQMANLREDAFENGFTAYAELAVKE